MQKRAGVRSRARLGRADGVPWLAQPSPALAVPLPTGLPVSAETPPATQVHEPQIQTAPWHLPTHSSKLSPDPPKYSPNLPTSPPHLLCCHPPSNTHHLLVDCCLSLLTGPPPPGSSRSGLHVGTAASPLEAAPRGSAPVVCSQQRLPPLTTQIPACASRRPESSHCTRVSVLAWPDTWSFRRVGAATTPARSRT